MLPVEKSMVLQMGSQLYLIIHKQLMVVHPSIKLMAVKEILSQTEIFITKSGMVLRALTIAVAVGNLVENEYKADTAPP